MSQDNTRDLFHANEVSKERAALKSKIKSERASNFKVKYPKIAELISRGSAPPPRVAAIPQAEYVQNNTKPAGRPVEVQEPEPEPPKPAEQTIKAEPPQPVVQMPKAEPPQPVGQVPKAEPPKPVVQVPKPEPPKPVVQVPKAEPPKPVVQVPKPEPPKPVTRRRPISSSWYS